MRALIGDGCCPVLNGNCAVRERMNVQWADLGGSGRSKPLNTKHPSWERYPVCEPGQRGPERELRNQTSSGACMMFLMKRENDHLFHLRFGSSLLFVAIPLDSSSGSLLFLFFQKTKIVVCSGTDTFTFRLFWS